MRVGYITYGLDRSPTGIGRYAVEVLRSLAVLPERPEVVLLTTERVDYHGLWDVLEHHPLPGCHLLPALMTVGNALLSLAVRRHRLDLIHDPNGIAPFLGPAFGAQRVVTIHDAFAYAQPENHNRLDNLRYRTTLRYAARKADVVLTDSVHSCDDLARYLNITRSKMHVVPCGVDQRFRPMADSAARRDVLARHGIAGRYLLYVGGINARKNVARLFAAYARVREHHSDVALVVAGQRQWRTAEIDAAVGQLDLLNSVHFTGYLPDVDLPALYSAAEAFVFPSLYEGFGLPVLEAMACGTPVVTSNVSSLPEVAGDAALLIDPLDVAAIAGAMRRLLEDPSLAASLRDRGLARAWQFTWERAARETLAVYRRVLHTSSELNHSREFEIRN